MKDNVLFSFFIVVLASYFLGAIPFSFLIAKYFKGIDLRKIGSGNPGATNVYRSCGFKYAFFAFLFDALKGFIAVYLIPKIFFDVNSDYFVYSRIIAFFTVVAGHNWTVFLKFKGGKGVATSAGAIAAFSLKVFGVMFCLWWIFLLATGIVSVSSILTAVSFPVLLYFFGYEKEYIIFGVFLAAVTILRHKENIKRLLKGEEKRIWRRKAK